jgi:hypothetical protein
VPVLQASTPIDKSRILATEIFSESKKRQKEDGVIAKSRMESIGVLGMPDQ